jgi:hypothetical protein
MEPDATIKVYSSPEQAAVLIEERLADSAGSSGMASLGRERVVGVYSKSLQWQHFVDLVERL